MLCRAIVVGSEIGTCSDGLVKSNMCSAIVFPVERRCATALRLQISLKSCNIKCAGRGMSRGLYIHFHSRHTNMSYVSVIKICRSQFRFL